MIHGYYFRFYQITHNKKISIILSRLCYFLRLIKYCLMKLKTKKEVITISEQEARLLIDKVNPDHPVNIHYDNPERKQNIHLSIVIPIYNYKEVIKECIESVLNQKTRYNYELILVDDGSTDGAKEIVESYSNYPNVKTVFQKNQGIAAARNTGINCAQGQYLMFIDCDDTIHNDMVEVLINKALETDSDIVMCAHNLVKERNGEVYQIVSNIYSGANLLGYRNGDEIMNYAGLPWAKVYKRALWDQVRFFHGYWYEDTIIHFLLFTQCKKFTYVPVVEYEYRWYEKNFSHTQGHSKNNKATDRYWITKHIIEHYKKMGCSVDSVFYTQIVKHLSSYYYTSIKCLEEDVQKAMFRLASELVKQNKPVSDCKMPYVLKDAEQALLTGDFNLWKLSCKYQ